MNIEITHASLDLQPVIQNMMRFYAYDLSRSCGFYTLFDWSFPENGLYEGPNIERYWQPDCHPFIIRVDGELAGFALINKKGTAPDVEWNMGEFFIVAKFQGRGVGREVAVRLFTLFPGVWEVMQMPANTPAIHFWRKVITAYTDNCFTQENKLFPEPVPHENVVLKFVSEV